MTVLVIPERKNLECRIGDTFIMTFFFNGEPTDPTDPLSGVALDMTGWTPRMQVRRRPKTDPAIADWVSSYWTTDDAASGEMVMEVPAAETAVLTPGVYSYDVQLTHSDGEVLTFAEGKFSIVWDVTRD